MPDSTAIVVGLLGIFGMIGAVLSIPLYAIWTYHKRKLEEIRAHKDVNIAEETRKAIDELKDEFRELRDQTSSFDVSMDTSMQRLESRISNIEQRTRYSEAADEPIHIQAGRQ